MKKIISLAVAALMLLTSALAAPVPPEIKAKSGVLMEKETGQVLYEKNAHEKLAPASVTKVMTLLLVTEALDSGRIKLTDTVVVSKHAAGMGGSQVYLEEGEQMSLEDMLKAVIISSANDGAVALAEHVAGSHESFVALMNRRAKELGMNDTNFINCTGLDAEGHVTSAYDIAVMSRELIKHDIIKKYSTIWMDSLRNGEFGLTNTNKLIKSYKGITGLKTGSTSIAKFSMSATAERDGMELIAAVMAAENSQDRFESASKLLDFGFANYSLFDGTMDLSIDPVNVVLGTKNNVRAGLKDGGRVLIDKLDMSKIGRRIDMPDNIKAPVERGQKLGEMIILNDETELARIPITAEEQVSKLDTKTLFWRMLSVLLVK
ncbi:MAG: D-alanyl-D-alanine carboxypeptidase [Clostridiales bacterium]|jgi:D-alanyl-D-alanine carboxypeptidase (penicillin-binding protein 5/6)|nr:D-alanyl-D-alanine carboxypeptidase [Clostridiales bacterium]